MRTAYKVLAYLIALEVVIQGALIAFAVAGIGVWVNEEGGTLDEAAFESIFDGDLTFTGIAGMMLHGMNGMMIIPLLALVFLIVSFFAKVPGGIKLALAVLALVVLQVFLGLLGHSTPYGGLLHGANAFLLLGTAVYAGQRATKGQPIDRPAENEPARV
jgi:hypothetical protein